MASDNKDLKIFKLNRLKFNQLWQDAIDWVKQTYNVTGEQFTLASPFAQLLHVILNLGRMIFYYIEDSITGLNIKTAYRPDQIRGLARLTGHNAGRAIAARGAIRIVYKDTGNIDLNGKVCFIPNKTKILSTINGSAYTILFGADTAQITMNAGNFVQATIIQGTIKYQAATSNGLDLQTYNFTERNYADIDEYFINVYVNGERWDLVDSLNDMGYMQKACIVKTGVTSGIDIIFGNNIMGKSPDQGSSIYVEYLVTDGAGGNLPKEILEQSTDLMQLQGVGYMKDGSEVSLIDNFYVVPETDIIFGSAQENIQLTQLIAPHTSRSYVLANDVNYRYFFKRMNMFSTVEIIKGYTQKDTNKLARLNYDIYNKMYKNVFNDWQETVSAYGESSTEAKNIYSKLQDIINKRSIAEQQINDTDMQDNTVYILLIPDISKRISSSSNYFTCNESLFTLSKDEQDNIINLIESTGQRIITIENKILKPKVPRFSINAQVKVWEGYNMNDIYSRSLSVISNYFIYFKRKDIIPVSDIVALLEDIEGIDSVKVWFDADVNNNKIYCKNDFYGIDEYGDIILTREFIDINGNTKKVNDILPLVRGGFISKDGVEYSADQSMEHLSAFNLSLIEYTKKTTLNLENYQSIT